ncbi:4a-hydroxytetrahydrobiopterin dehydratase [Corallococcus sp. H22C18031201]|uniref:4a-hydroxytetrahydrobiopterin dehydratase n=1 Tax=Citreicoccus inhibens TaxID=2849499 RepID=UPI000E75E5B1|nr:4a-hydroxytetrahydrobiopterin dehydratase [Citreicoccus inhibens]MBJ6763490.1 4a-hydroxytetrahydrobiopterin dehydratase [Myxococcaceae bacterium JPH2]MBU8899702.1 4a-hydroxytetrahydrobiopterin dehydratase [Citreicoccus inhibens]RJS18375.1 4a-hydroxytetrahydrobiopterin dehydratase [Corallococcus sp. H22C18031201]
MATDDLSLIAPAALASFLARHPDWKHEGGMIRRTYEAPDFLAGIAFVERVAHAAESANHHPDIDIRWRKVTLALVTHDAGGLTHRDTDLAAEADRLFAEVVRSK